MIVQKNGDDLRKQVVERQADVARIEGVINRAEKEIESLSGSIAAEEERTKIVDPAHPAYSTKATSDRRRRANLEQTNAFLRGNDLALARQLLEEATDAEQTFLRHQSRKAKRVESEVKF